MMTVTELINSTVNVGYCCFGRENICFKFYGIVLQFSDNF